MNNQEKLNYWKEIALYDLSTAEAMYTSKRYLYVSFMCVKHGSNLPIIIGRKLPI